MKKIGIIIVVCMFFCGVGFSQSAEKVSQIMEAQEVSLLDVSYFAATYLDIVEITTLEEFSLNALKRYAELSKIKDSTSALSYKEFSYFCTQVWNIPGGLFFTITRSPRYAFRELQSMSIIHPNVQPNDKINGTQALTIMTKIIEYSEQHNTIDLQQYVKMPLKFHIHNR